jgi:dTDP-4-dehydrorhamnose reductase
VINCAAYTAVDLAESDIKKCRAVNASAVAHLAAACAHLDCPLVQISTDYVFSGRPAPGRPYREDDPPSAEGIYAQTKLEGERAAARHAKHMIVRTCGLYARPSHEQAKNFVKTILRLAQSRPELRVVSDQHCTPSYVPHVARAVLFLLGVNGPWPGDCPDFRRYPATTLAWSGGGENGTVPFAAPRPTRWGIYHVTNTGATTWYEFACEIVHLAGLKTVLVPISTAEYGAAAPRPSYSVLDTTAYHRLGGPSMPVWKEAIAEYMKDKVLGLRS